MFLRTWVLYLAIPLIILLAVLIFKNFIGERFSDKLSTKRKRVHLQIGLFVSRTVILILLLIAIAEPISQTTTFETATPKVVVLTDTSMSMDVLDTTGVESLIDSLEQTIDVTKHTIGIDGGAAIGEELLTYVTENQPILLISDGQRHSGASMREVALFASQLNSSVSIVDLEASKEDTAIRIEGPARVVQGTDTTFTIPISTTHNRPVRVRVYLDGVEILQQDASSSLSFTRTFSEGEHVLLAEVDEDDHFPANNAYRKTITVVPQPKILHLTRKQSGLSTILDSLYTVDRVSSIPDNLDEYYAVVIEDVPMQVIDKTSVLRNFLEDAGGIFVLGGQSSFEQGSYGGSVFETLLPVRIGSGERNNGDANIAIAIDMSGSTSERQVPVPPQRNETLPAGPTTLTLEFASAGLDVDAILLTTDYSFIPSGESPSLPSGKEYVFVEAEDGAITGPGFQTLTDPGARGGWYLATVPRDTSGFGKSRLTVPITKAGTYSLWARVRIRSGTTQSMFTEIEPGGKQKWELEAKRSWAWYPITDIRRAKLQTVKSDVLALQKSLAISVIEDLHPGNKVGVLGFTFPIEGRTTQACTGACQISSVQQLGKTKDELIEKVSRADLTGNTAVWVGLEGALRMLEKSYGSLNVILITDGITNQQDRDRSAAVASAIAGRGGRLFVVQVGDDPSASLFLRGLASRGAGIYFRASQSNRLSILFGEPDSDLGEDAFSIVSLNAHHFITSGIEPSATLYGYNQVVPKTGAQQLLTSASGDPVLTIWNYGIGRVASFTGFNGPDYGDMLVSPNSKLLSRTANWLIGDPERKQSYRLSASDVTLGEASQVRVYSDKVPDSELSFEPIGKDVYAAEVLVEEVGVHQIIDTQFAVNYPIELRGVGISAELIDAVELSEGKRFSTGDVEGIVEYVRSETVLRKNTIETIQWPFLLTALLVLLIEIAARRISELRRRNI